MIARVEIHPGRYHDSVRLMQASKALQNVEGVTDALVAMATELNLSLLADMGFDMDAVADAGPNDLVLALRAENEGAIATAHLVLDDALTHKAAPSGGLDAPASEDRRFSRRSRRSQHRVVVRAGRTCLCGGDGGPRIWSARDDLQRQRPDRAGDHPQDVRR